MNSDASKADGSREKTSPVSGMSFAEFELIEQDRDSNTIVFIIAVGITGIICNIIGWLAFLRNYPTGDKYIIFFLFLFISALFGLIRESPFYLYEKDSVPRFFIVIVNAGIGLMIPLILVVLFLLLTRLGKVCTTPAAGRGDA
ncbi:hypothetical protein [Ottowia sp.]|uniref:hypothetical protein n=1 Tax=Ottowia sp. TaxID=1898956 RepID=UPI003A87C236